jgi:hypothetical protein
MTDKSDKCDKYDKSSDCKTFDNYNRNEAISYMYDKLSKSLVKASKTQNTETPNILPPIHLNECQKKYNTFLTKLYFSAIASVDSKSLCLLNTNNINSLLYNIATSSNVLMNDFMYSYANENLTYNGKKNSEGNGFNWVADPQNIICFIEKSINGVIIIPNTDYCYKLTITINTTIKTPPKLQLKDTTNPSYLVDFGVQNVQNDFVYTLTDDVPIRANQKIYIESDNYDFTSIILTLEPLKSLDPFCSQVINGVYYQYNIGAQMTFKDSGFDNRPFSYGTNYYYETDYTTLTYFTTNYIYWVKGKDCPCDYYEKFYYKTAFTFKVSLSGISYYVDLQINDSLCANESRVNEANLNISCTLYTNEVKVYCNTKKANLILNCGSSFLLVGREMRDLEVHISSKKFDPQPDC